MSTLMIEHELSIHRSSFEDYGQRAGLDPHDIAQLIVYATVVRPHYDERLIWHNWYYQVAVALRPLGTIIAVRQEEGHAPAINPLNTGFGLIAHEAGYSTDPNAVDLRLREDYAKAVARQAYFEAFGHARGLDSIMECIEATKPSSKTRVAELIGRQAVDAIAVRAADSHGLRRDYPDFEEATIRLKAEAMLLKGMNVDWPIFVAQDEAYVQAEYAQPLQLTTTHFYDAHGRSAWEVNRQTNYAELHRKAATAPGREQLELRTQQYFDEIMDGPYPVRVQPPHLGELGIWIPWEIAKGLAQGTALRDQWDHLTPTRQAELVTRFEGARLPPERLAVASHIAGVLRNEYHPSHLLYHQGRLP